MFLPSEVCANKLVLHSKLMIFIRYKNNGYCFIYHIQENKYKLYDKLLDKISLEIESSISSSFVKDRPAPVLILHISIPSIQTNSLTYSFSPFLFISIYLSYLPQSLKSP